MPEVFKTCEKTSEGCGDDILTFITERDFVIVEVWTMMLTPEIKEKSTFQ